MARALSSHPAGWLQVVRFSVDYGPDLAAVHADTIAGWSDVLVAADVLAQILIGRLRFSLAVSPLSLLVPDGLQEGLHEVFRAVVGINLDQGIAQ